MANKMTTCKVCGAEVAKSASVCPKCGAKLKRKHPALWIIIALAGIFIIIATVSSNSSNNTPKKVDDAPAAKTSTEVQATVNPTTKSSTEVQATEQAVQTRFGVGERVELNDVIVTLVSVTESKGSQYNTPTDGNVFVLCEFEIENNTKNELAISSMMSFSAYCDDYILNYSLPALMEKGNKNQLDGSIAPGKKMNGVVGYEAPADWKELEIKFQSNVWSSNNFTFFAEH